MWAWWEAFLEYAKADEPSIETADAFRAFLIDKRLSRGHINNVCFAIKKFYKMNNIDWEFIKLKTNDGLPYYFDEKDVLAIFSVCANIKHLAMLHTLLHRERGGSRDTLTFRSGMKRALSCALCAFLNR